MPKGVYKREHEGCSMDGCDRPHWGLGMCRMHHARFLRRGTAETIIYPDSRKLEHGYISIRAPELPISKEGWSYEHRAVYFRNNGYGPFLCHHCNCPISWVGMHIDHLDDNKENNNIGNLVASCAICNQMRGRHKIKEFWNNKGIEAFGERLALVEWARRFGITHQSIRSRIKAGWDIEKAISTPGGERGPKKSSSGGVGQVGHH